MVLAEGWSIFTVSDFRAQGCCMKTFAACTMLLLVVPMANPLGREAFLGYYTGVVAMWAAVVFADRGRLAADRHS